MARNISLHKTSLIGQRDDNEDVESYLLNLSIKGDAIDSKFAPIDFFVICDGHGGKNVAEFVVSLLQKHLTKSRLKYPLSYKYICKVYSYIQQSLIGHVKHIAAECGCTALVLIRYADEQNIKFIQVINLGDCRAVLSKNGIAMPLSKDHKPHWPDEKVRINQVNQKHNMNEQIYVDEYNDWRIGGLSVSRAFGDLDNVPHVSHIPDIFSYQLIDNEDEFIVLACDGIYDVMENHDVINFVRDYMKHSHIETYKIPHKFPPKELVNSKNIARLLAEYAIANGSTDNVSVMIIFFDRKA